VLFTEPTFLFLFLPVLLALLFAPALVAGARRHSAYANLLLLAASIAFYAKGGGSFTWLMLGSIAFNYWMAIAIDRSRLIAGRAERLLAVAVGINLLVLAVFKYTNFAGENINSLFLVLHVRPLPVPRILLPIGISFFTFHAISYVVDVYRRDASAQKSPVHAALYLLLFPQLIAGPIIRYRQIADQLAERRLSFDDFGYGVRRFIIGLGKKVLVANVVAGPADRIFSMPMAEMTAAHAWLAIICYTIQIYFDFSGYSDMAVGLAWLIGFRFPQNFNSPFKAVNVSDFWRRWHMSLSAWFRDYLFIPLGGSRRGPSRTVVNLVITMFLAGLWHGAAWTFVVWGLLHGAALGIHGVLKRAGMTPRSTIVNRVLTFAYVIAAFVIFRAPNLHVAGTILSRMAGSAGVESLSTMQALLPSRFVVLMLGLLVFAQLAPNTWQIRLKPRLVYGLATGAAAAAAVMSIAVPHPFIYFQF
jgi:alginate O-acetyltransferase complex protein AlgI